MTGVPAGDLVLWSGGIPSPETLLLSWFGWLVGMWSGGLGGWLVGSVGGLSGEWMGGWRRAVVLVGSLMGAWMRGWPFEVGERGYRQERLHRLLPRP